MNYEKFDVYLGYQIYCARVVKKITQDQMSKMISAKMKESGLKKGISRQAYSFYEKGERSMPMHIFTYACEILDLDRNAIFNDACDHLKIR